MANELGWCASGRNGALAGGGSKAVAAGLEVLERGGNAIDAAVTTIFALAVTDFDQYFCFGGEVPILVFDARRGVVEVVCGQGGAPELATREHFAERGHTPDEGPEAPAVPGVLDACLTALGRYGTLTFADAIAPALRLLQRGERDWHRRFAATLRTLVAAERRTRDRSAGLRRVADCFYRGPVARAIDEWSRAAGGLIRYHDLARHVTRIEAPIRGDYRGFTVCKCGPWSQGPVLLQALALLEGFDLRCSGRNSVALIHLITEAIKLAWADRDVYYGDPLYVPVPLAALLAPRYTLARRQLIDGRRASATQRPGNPLEVQPILHDVAGRLGPAAGAGRERDTTNCVVADRWGNVVAATPSGAAGGEAGSTGVMMGNRLECFNVWKGHPNCIRPGKRPRTTLTPTLVLQDGKPVLAVSVAGGDLQDQTTLQMLVDWIDFDVTAGQCVTAPRFFTRHLVGSFNQKPPELGSLYLSNEFGGEVGAGLKATGHRVTTVDRPQSHDVMVSIDRESGVMQAAGDPRTNRHAAAF